MQSRSTRSGTSYGCASQHDDATRLRSRKNTSQKTRRLGADSKSARGACRRPAKAGHDVLTDCGAPPLEAAGGSVGKAAVFVQRSLSGAQERKRHTKCSKQRVRKRSAEYMRGGRRCNSARRVGSGCRQTDPTAAFTYTRRTSSKERDDTMETTMTRRHDGQPRRHEGSKENAMARRRDDLQISRSS